MEHHEELTVIIEAALAGVPAEQLIGLLDEAGIANAQLRTPQEFAEHPQLAARDRWREVETPGGVVPALLPPVTVPGREPLMGPVPALGQHNDSIRAELGLGSRGSQAPGAGVARGRRDGWGLWASRAPGLGAEAGAGWLAGDGWGSWGASG